MRRSGGRRPGGGGGGGDVAGGGGVVGDGDRELAAKVVRFYGPSAARPALDARLEGPAEDGVERGLGGVAAVRLRRDDVALDLERVEEDLEGLGL